MALISDRALAAERFVTWLAETVVERARGGDKNEINGKPSDRFWLGRLAPASISARSGKDNRGDRLEPCQIGIRLRPTMPGPWEILTRISLRLWRRNSSGVWGKLPVVLAELPILVSAEGRSQVFGVEQLTYALEAAGGNDKLSAEVRVEVGGSADKPELSLSFVNTSQLDDDPELDPRFYETRLSVAQLSIQPFQLDSLEDTFRYDRSVPAYGINCAVTCDDLGFHTADVPTAEKWRPQFWGAATPEPDFSFAILADDPVGAATKLAQELAAWGAIHWSEAALDARAAAERWTPEMLLKAKTGAAEFATEVDRIRDGVRLLTEDSGVRRAFVLMNRSMQSVGARKGYLGWRPFQLGFLLANLASLRDDQDEANVVDIVWFATGGGKTETYLGLLITASFLDRSRGKKAGITAWCRFPLRMLSLQQMQRFADAMAAAELVRRAENIEGAAFSVGFLVGDGASPNRVRRPEQQQGARYDPDDPDMPKRFRMLQQCPFCASSNLEMKFETATWTLQHRCLNSDCPWPERGLPFYVVDEEIFRFLPTAVIGTLDKAASIGLQQAMRGLVGAPRGCCSSPNHGFTYNVSSQSKHGCLVPDCAAIPQPLGFDGKLVAPSYRLQDELHLLRDSLGAVDAHYEATLDGLQFELSGRKAKVVASSATLSGYEKQSSVLYQRRARVFPQPGPSPQDGFWSKSTETKMRRFMAIAPRGATLEFAIDRLINELQSIVRLLHTNPVETCESLGIDPSLAAFLLSQYGTDVVFGSTLRDLDAVSRSSGTQLVDIEGRVNEASLTGRTQFEDVSAILDKLQKSDEEAPFEERIHMVTASSMMSHGVDVDRLNVMIVVGLPLTTAEFIQATARVGRKWPALVLVVHKIGRERDAGIFRSFQKYVEQGDRFVEPIPITGRSRRVLERTLPGVEMSRLLHVHAAHAVDRFTTVNHVRKAIRDGHLKPSEEAAAVMKYLGYNQVADDLHRADVHDAIEAYFDRIDLPFTKATEWYGKTWTTSPMNSLRDVEEQVTVHLRREP